MVLLLLGFTMLFTVLKVVVDGETTFDRIQVGGCQEYKQKIGILDAEVKAIAFGMTGEESLAKLRELRKNS